MKLTPRLEKIVDKLPCVEILADIGCDHGFVGAYALQKGVAQKVIFCDVSQLSLQKAQNLMQKTENSTQKLQGGLDAEFVCQDGIGDIMCDCAVIAGMGGLEIIKILQQALHLPQHLVLQPMRNQFDLRSFLCNNYLIESDSMFCDKKFYDLIVATRGKDSLTRLQLLFGKTNLTMPSNHFQAYLNKQTTKCNKILQQCPGAKVKQWLLDLTAASKIVEEK